MNSAIEPFHLEITPIDNKENCYKIKYNRINECIQFNIQNFLKNNSEDIDRLYSDFCGENSPSQKAYKKSCEKIGDVLFCKIFTKQIFDKFTEFYRRTENRCISLKIPDNLQVLPWELLYYQDKKYFIALHGLFFRYIDPINTIHNKSAEYFDLTLIYAHSSPKGYPVLSQLALDTPRENFLITHRQNSTLEDLESDIKKYQSKNYGLWFVGHGDYHEQDEEGHLIFCKSVKNSETTWTIQADRIPGSQLSQAINRKHPKKCDTLRVIGLWACNSTSSCKLKYGFEKTVTGSMIQTPAMFIIGIQHKIKENTIDEFLSNINDSINEEKHEQMEGLDEIIKKARNHVFNIRSSYENNTWHINLQWWIPVLYSRTRESLALLINRTEPEKEFQGKEVNNIIMKLFNKIKTWI